MERPNKFDQAVNDKMTGMQAEPSARVWSNIRAEIGPAELGAVASPWPYRIGVAATVAFLIGFGWWVNRSERVTGGQGGTLATEDSVPTQLVAPPLREEQQFADQGKGVAPRKVDFLPGAFLSPEASVAPQAEPVWEDKVYANTVQPLPTRELEEMDLQPLPFRMPEEQEEMMANGEPLPAGSRKRYRVPSLQNLDLDDLREGGRGLLPTLANGATNYLGVKTSYETKEEESSTVTAFSADFKLFKVRKVKHIKE